MTTWRENRSNEIFIYRSVNRENWQESTGYGDVTGGSTELAAFTDYKASSVLDFEGYNAPVQDSLVRVYYAFDEEENHEEVCIGTFVTAYADTDEQSDYVGSNRVGTVVSGSAACAGVLELADRDGPGYPYTVKQGTQAILQAALILEACGLRVIVSGESSYTLRADHTFEENASWLTIASWLATTASFRSPYPDVFGSVILAPDIPASSPAWRFAEGKNSIMHPVIRVNNDWQSRPNIIRAYYADENVSIWAAAYNDSGSRTSIDKRGPNSQRFTVTELDGETGEEKLEALKEWVMSKLDGETHELEHIEIEHPYAPIAPFDIIEVDNGTSRLCTVTNIVIEHAPSAMCTTKARRFVRSEISSHVEGGII